MAFFISYKSLDTYAQDAIHNLQIFKLLRTHINWITM
jgi:hypothetical protein